MEYKVIEMSKRTGLTRQTIYNHEKELVEKGIAERTEIERKTGSNRFCRCYSVFN